MFYSYFFSICENSVIQNFFLSSQVKFLGSAYKYNVRFFEYLTPSFRVQIYEGVAISDGNCFALRLFN